MYLIQIPDHLAQEIISRLPAAKTPTPAPAEPGYYTSNALPPDCPSKARFHVVVKTVPGAVKRGRVWLVPVDAWTMHRAAHVVTVPGLPAGFRKVA